MSSPSSAPDDDPGRLHTRAFPHVPATPRESMPKLRPSASLARRIASAIPGASRSIPARVPSGVRSRGPNPVPPVVTTSPANPSHNEASAVATSSTPSAETRWSTTWYPAAVSRSTSAPPLLSSRVPSATPSETVSTFAWSFTASRAHRPGRGQGIVGAEDARTGHEDVNARVECDLRVVDLDTAVDLDLDRQLARVDLRACGACLVEHLGNERLAAETRVHTHHEQEVDVTEVRLHGVERSLGLERESGAHVAPADLFDQ